MKKLISLNLLVIFLLLGVNPAKSIGEEEYSKRLPEFMITKRTIDSSLSKGKSKLFTTFYDNQGLMKNKTIRFGKNNDEMRIITDSTGRALVNLKNGKYKFYFYYNSAYEEVISDSVKIKDQEVVEVSIHFMTEYRNMNVKKPVIYVYPNEEMNVNIQLNVNGELGFTYPKYNNGWNFIASPNGNIEFENKNYNYLFWESDIPSTEIKRENNNGFLVATDTLLSFLENSLTTMGMNSKESADFITFWYPQMIKNESNHIHFLFNDACNTYAELNITPKPENIFRVGILWSDAKSNFIPEKQIIPSFSRNGFTLIEWGGIEMENLFENEN